MFINQGIRHADDQFADRGNSISRVTMSGMGIGNGQVVLLTNNNTYTGTTYVSGVIAELDNLTGVGLCPGHQHATCT